MERRRFGPRAGLWSVGVGAVLMVLQACGGRAVGAEGENDAKAGSLGTGATDSGSNLPGSPIGMMPGRPPTAGAATSGGRAVVVEAGAPTVGGAGFESGAPNHHDPSYCEAGGASPVCDFGRPCLRNADCAENDCYFPGTGENPICAQRCMSDGDCLPGSACTGPLGDNAHCFVLCHDAAECQAINANPINPLDCVDMGDFRAPQGQTVCAQSSEP
jgi:hypothetical protein